MADEELEIVDSGKSDAPVYDQSTHDVTERANAPRIRPRRDHGAENRKKSNPTKLRKSDEKRRFLGWFDG